MNPHTPMLLPSGLYDLLPPDAAKESRSLECLLEVFYSFGYDQVSPPLMEFETGLLAGRSNSLSRQTFRVADPVSHDMMGIRPDMTLQVGRIAASRLSDMPRPLRLCYAGQILQTTAEPLRNERQLTQAGIELIGTDSMRADAEVIIIAAESLAALSIQGITIDLNVPGLVAELCPEAHDNPALQERIREALTHKSPEMLAELDLKNGTALVKLMKLAGPLDMALSAIAGLHIAQLGMVTELYDRIARSCPYLKVTIDPLEYRGFDYHSGISFSIFARGVRHELGRGGRYKAGGEDATGFTLYVTHLLPVLPQPLHREAVMIAEDTPVVKIQELHRSGLRTIYALTNDIRLEAEVAGCDYILSGEEVTRI